MVVIGILDQVGTYLADIVFQVAAGDSAQGHNPVFPAFAGYDAEVAFMVIDISQGEVVQCS